MSKEVVYEVDNEESGVLAQVLTWPNIMWKYRVIVHDVDACAEVGYKSFKTLREAEAYADKCVEFA